MFKLRKYIYLIFYSAYIFDWALMDMVKAGDFFNSWDDIMQFFKAWKNQIEIRFKQISDKK